MQALHLLLDRHEHYITRGVHISAHSEIQLVKERHLAASVVTAGRCTPTLGTTPASAVVVPASLAGVVAIHGRHLLRKQHLVEIMHLVIPASVVIFLICMFPYIPGGIHLETLDSQINELLQMIHPMLQSGCISPLSHGYGILFSNRQIIIFTNPQPQVVSHTSKPPDEHGAPILFRKFVLHP